MSRSCILEAFTDQRENPTSEVAESREEIHFRVTGRGSLRVLLLHALTGGPDAADREDVIGWWASIFREGAPLEAGETSVWTPNLPGSCYGTRVARPQAGWSTRSQAQVLARWIQREGLSFDLLLGASLGGMVALELALLLPDHFPSVAVVGCGGRAEAWLWGTTEVQRAILQSPNLGDAEAMALARRAAMLSFRTPESIGSRFQEAREIQDWLCFHGAALAGRFTRQAYLNLLEAMDRHDLGRDRGGLRAALGSLRASLHILGMDSDQLIPPAMVLELAEEARKAGAEVSLDWLQGPHGHDGFLIQQAEVESWLKNILCSCKMGRQR